MIKKIKEQVFTDPLYGYITVEYDVIMKIIDSNAFQRLRRIRQLSGVSMIFHGAEHSRFSHSLGTYHIATKFLKNESLNNYLSEREKLLFLTTALVHDIGHGPYSHAFEDVFKTDHEILGAKIIKEDKELNRILNRVDKEFLDDVASIILKEGKHPILEQLISSQLDVDRIDYLLRDAYFTGTPYGNIDIDRLIRVLDVKENKVVFRENGINAIENYLINRYHMYWQVYFHRVCRAYEVILEKIYLRIKDLLKEEYKFNCNIEPIRKIIDQTFNISDYLSIDDYYINGLFSSFINSNDEILKVLSKDFLDRNIWSYIDVNTSKVNDIIKNMTKDEIKYFTATRKVYEQTYPTEEEGKIYILLNNNKISSLYKESKIIKSLSSSGQKTDEKFFFRKWNHKYLLLKVKMI